ncbi:MAG: FIST N-terminal domain-containing protein [Candidatus Omnitrophota bacterium]
MNDKLLAQNKFTVGIGLGINKEPLQAIKQATQEARVNLSAGSIDLALVFSSPDFSYSPLLKTVNDLLGNPPMIGCSSLGIITNTGIRKHAIAVMLLSLPEGACVNTACVSEISAKSAYLSGEELGKKLLSGFTSLRRSLSVVFSDGMIKDSSGFLSGLQEQLGLSFPLVGAAASDNLRFAKTYVYYGQHTISDAACGIIWGGKLNFGLGIRHGWKALGKPRQVTRAIGNVVYEIDGASATNIYEEYFSCNLENLKKELKRISIFYPIGIYLPHEKEYLLRNLSAVEDNGSLVFQGNVPEGSAIRLMIGTKESCLAATRQAAEEAKKGLGSAGAKFVLVFDSISRYMLLGKQAGKELEIIKDTFGTQTPILGFYSLGEQAPLQAIDYMGKAYVHNQTVAVLAIGS